MKMTVKRKAVCWSAGVSWLVCGFILGLSFPVSAEQTAPSIQQQLTVLLQVQEQGGGHQAAQEALRELQNATPEALLPILEGLEQANPLAANWLKNAFEAIAFRTLKQAPEQLPQAELLAFVNEKSHRPTSRRMVFEWLRKINPEQAEQLIPGFLTDPSDELRREAVAALLQAAEALPADDEQRKKLFEQALAGASDDDQVRQIVAGLKKFDVAVNLHQHYGLLTRWSIIGPFDNKDEKGFPIVYPPEEKLDLQAEYAGQLGPVSWKPVRTEEGYGVVNLATELGPYKGAVVYAHTDFRSDREQPVEFRLATPNAWKLWVNGELLFEREEYHRGNFFDQYRIPATLKAGSNDILLKVCQNEQEQSWAQDWKIQFRVCNPYGMAVHPQP